MSKIVFHIKKTVYDEVILSKTEALEKLKSMGCSNEKLLFTILSGRIQSLKIEADDSDWIPHEEKMEAVEEFLEGLIEEQKPSSHPTDTFNPTLSVRLNGSGDAFEVDLMECVCELIIVDGVLIRRKNLDKIKKPNSDIREANLLELLNHELIHDPLPEWSAWMSSELDKRAASK